MRWSSVARVVDIALPRRRLRGLRATLREELSRARGFGRRALLDARERGDRFLEQRDRLAAALLAEELGREQLDRPPPHGAVGAHRAAADLQRLAQHRLARAAAFERLQHERDAVHP